MWRARGGRMRTETNGGGQTRPQVQRWRERARRDRKREGGVYNPGK